MKQLVALLFCLSGFQAVTTLAQGPKAVSLAELAVYSGADREQALVAGAKKEGKLVWYTAMAGGSYKELARSFEAKYGVQVEAYRGTSNDLISKVLAESQAKKFLMDVAESSPPLLMLMRSMNLLAPFYVPHLAKYLSEAKEETGKGTVYFEDARRFGVMSAMTTAELQRMLANLGPDLCADLYNWELAICFACRLRMATNLFART